MNIIVIVPLFLNRKLFALSLIVFLSEQEELIIPGCGNNKGYISIKMHNIDIVNIASESKTLS